MNDLNLAVIGNCSYGALIDKQARIVWACLPRFDSDPVFCSLMDGGEEASDYGDFTIDIEDFARSEQCYLHNSAIVVTTLYDTHGSALEITDFAPRFKQHGRTYRPEMIVRRIQPVIGNPRIADAVARWAATVERESVSAVSPAVRATVERALQGARSLRQSQNATAATAC